MKDKRVRVALLIGLVLVLYGHPHASGIYYDPQCPQWDPFSLWWYFQGCWVW